MDKLGTLCTKMSSFLFKIELWAGCILSDGMTCPIIRRPALFFMGSQACLYYYKLGCFAALIVELGFLQIFYWPATCTLKPTYKRERVLRGTKAHSVSRLIRNMSPALRFATAPQEMHSAPILEENPVTELDSMALGHLDFGQFGYNSMNFGH